MRLLDQVAQVRSPICVIQANGDRLALPGADMVAPEIATCPLRYVLDDELARVCSEIAFSTNGVLSDCCDILHAPAGAVWIEFTAESRHDFLVSRGLAPVGRMCQKRIGVLLRTRPADSRAGRIDILWENEAGLTPEWCPVFAEFDLDDSGFGRTGGVPLGSDLAHGLSFLAPLLERMRFRLDPVWADYYRNYCPSDRDREQAVGRYVAYVIADAPMVLSLLLLTMSGRAIRSTPIEYRRLNAARAKRGKPPLLEHMELRLELPTAANASWPPNSPSAEGSRQAPRLHLVRGHLVRRQDQVFWRSAHLRGDVAKGEVKTRTYRVGLGS